MENMIDTQNKQQMLAYELIANTNSSFFLTGRAGTGKTTFLRNVQKMVNKQFITLAPTGVAAILAGGETIHSFFGLPMDVCTPGTMGKMSEARILTLLHTNTIIIDEVSMVRCDIIDAIDYTMRKTLRTSLPFGGKQVVFVGDMFQLPPVVKQGAEHDLMRDLYHTDDCFFYKADVIKRMRMVKIEFQKVYRQEDESFLGILENVRLNKTTPENLMHLNERVCQPTKEDGLIITLTSLNKTADSINQRCLAEINAEEYIYEGTVNGKFEEKRFPVDKILRLKIGAQVMFTRNDPNRRWANGTIGTVSKLSKDEIQVTIGNGETYVVPNCSWESYCYEYDKENRKMTKEKIGSLIFAAALLALGLAFNSCGGKKSDTPSNGDEISGRISLSGAFALYPLAVKWAEDFQKLHPKVKIEVDGGGAGKGMTDVLTGQVELGMVSREVSSEEAEKGAVGFAVAANEEGGESELAAVDAAHGGGGLYQPAPVGEGEVDACKEEEGDVIVAACVDIVVEQQGEEEHHGADEGGDGCLLQLFETGFAQHVLV